MKEENVKSEYQRKVDKSLIPTCNIMGVNIAAINMNWLLKMIIGDIVKRSLRYTGPIGKAVILYNKKKSI